MAWASSGGYPGVVSAGYGVLHVATEIDVPAIFAAPNGLFLVQDDLGNAALRIGPDFANDGLQLERSVGMFNHAPPAAATIGGAHTAGGTYTAVEQAMLEAAYTALQSIGLIT